MPKATDRKHQGFVAKGKEVLGGHGSTGDYPNQTRAQRVEDIPFARALGSAQRGEGIGSEKGVTAGTEGCNSWYTKSVIAVTQKRDSCYAFA